MAPLGRYMAVLGLAWLGSASPTPAGIYSGNDTAPGNYTGDYRDAAKYFGDVALNMALGRYLTPKDGEDKPAPIDEARLANSGKALLAGMENLMPNVRKADHLPKFINNVQQLVSVSYDICIRRDNAEQPGLDKAMY